ncbi:tryptophan halogenase family protein [Rheinheimera sp.]|uniref:tryptophan halogenase family protein n=1 Tax=Rheinheimera sp. TaxID=1869214 RepID=UPI003AF5E293
MNTAIQQIVIVGGGAAGWLTASLLAAELNYDQGKPLAQAKVQISLIESPDVQIIGVGEGTWPSMRHTLEKIGLSETEFLIASEASFKQGSEFYDWHGPQQGYYLHPFTLPAGYPEFNLAPYWLPFASEVSFAEAVCPQQELVKLGLAPKQISTAQYSFINNYGYHLNAGKFTQLLQQHATSKLGVQYLPMHIQAVEMQPDGRIAAVVGQHGERVAGDLFVDCSGQASLLLGEQLQVPWISQQHILFNDSALAIQVPYAKPDSPIASCTKATAQPAGWVWDIALPSRRGIGHVFSAAHCSEEQARQRLASYLDAQPDLAAANADDARLLRFEPGYRARCFEKNCVAIGMAAGFIEPLEASALALVEWTAKSLAALLPGDISLLPVMAARINAGFSQHWQQIVEFLKLHYVLSRRADHDYWFMHRERNSIPDSLQQLLQLWRHQPPMPADIRQADQLFPAASYQYVLMGMGLDCHYANDKASLQQKARQYFQDNQKKTAAMRQALSANRELLEKIHRYGLPTL